MELRRQSGKRFGSSGHENYADGTIMSVNLSIVLELYHLQASEVALLPGRINDSTRMRQAAEQLWAVMRPRWPGLGSVDSFASLIPRERLSTETSSHVES